MKKLEIGISQDELQKQVLQGVIDKIVEHLTDEDYDIETRVKQALTKKLDELVAKKIESAVLPLAKAKLDGLIIPTTNRYGEPKGEPMTFIEYATKKAEEYMQEPVNFEGKAKGDRDSYSWTGTQTRITHMVHHYLHYSIETAMKNALANANSQIVGGIEQTVKTKLAEISAQLKVTVSNGR